MVNELQGKVAIVTGGAAGLGRAMASRFQKEGAKVVIADVNRQKGKEVADELGPDVAFVETDVSKADQVQTLVSSTVERFGGVDVLVNNAGIPGRMIPRFLDDDLSDFHRIMDVDLLGVMLCTRYAAQHMTANGGGSVINITSIGGTFAGCSEWTYRAAKAGVAHFSKCVAIDLARDDIRVNCIAPGAIVTDILNTATADPELTATLREIMREIRPLDRQGTAEDIAEAALYLASDRAKYVTGTVLPVDGGMTAGYPGNPLSKRD